jgi:glyoxylase-like metal-dependent hydrolase (beta-lactamase superfamily II)
LAVAGDLRPLFPFPAFGTWNKERSLQSAKKLMHLKPAILACGHGELLFEPAQVMGEAIARLEKKIN